MGNSRSNTAAAGAPMSAEKKHADPSGEPRPTHEKSEPDALQRHAAGPVGDRRQHEPGNGGRRKAEGHLMAMPVQLRQHGRQLGRAAILREPQRNTDAGPYRGQ